MARRTSTAHPTQTERADLYREITEVRGPCSDADLVLIERLAREADTRPVAVHRFDPLASQTERAAA